MYKYRYLYKQATYVQSLCYVETHMYTYVYKYVYMHMYMHTHLHVYQYLYTIEALPFAHETNVYVQVYNRIRIQYNIELHVYCISIS